VEFAKLQPPASWEKKLAAKLFQGENRQQIAKRRPLLSMGVIANGDGKATSKKNAKAKAYCWGKTNQLRMFIK